MSSTAEAVEEIDAPVTEEVEAVEVEAEAEPSTEETDSGEEEATTEVESSDSSPEKEDRVQQRIDEITKQYRMEERQRVQQEQANQELQRQMAELQERLEPRAEPGKTLADFDYDETRFAEYSKSIAKQEAAEEFRQQQAQEQQRQRIAEYSVKEAEFAKDLPDYYQKAHHSPISETVANMIVAADDGPALAYHIGDNPDVAIRLSQLDPTSAAMELGRISERIAAAKLTAPKAPSVTQAPKPVPKIAATDNKVSVDPEKMTDAQFRKWREKQIANR